MKKNRVDVCSQSSARRCEHQTPEHLCMGYYVSLVLNSIVCICSSGTFPLRRAYYLHLNHPANTKKGCPLQKHPKQSLDPEPTKTSKGFGSKLLEHLKYTTSYVTKIGAQRCCLFETNSSEMTVIQNYTQYLLC